MSAADTKARAQKAAAQFDKRTGGDGSDPALPQLADALIAFAAEEVRTAVKAERERMQRLMSEMMRDRTERDIELAAIERSKP